MSPRPVAPAVWEDVRGGRHLAVLGAIGIELPPHWSPMVVRVRCDGGRELLDPILEARRSLKRLLGEAVDGSSEAARPESIGLRHRLLPDAPVGTSGDSFLELCERIHSRTHGGAVLVFEGVDRADEATMSFLRGVLLGARRVQLPLVLTFEGVAAQGPAALLLAAVRASGGEVVTAEIAPRAAQPQATLPRLDAAVMRTLRVGALLGDEFDAPTVAQLLEIPEMEVLEHVQAAADAGVAIGDDGAMRFRLPAQLAGALRGSMLSSLALARRRQLLRGRPAVATAVGAAGGLRARGPTAEVRHAPAAEMAAAGARDSALAEQVERALASSNGAEQLGAFDTAVTHLRRVLARAAEDSSDGARRARAKLLSNIGRLLWRGAGSEYEFTLPAALQILAEAKSTLRDGDPAELTAEVAIITAHVCYDLGDGASLARAVDELVHAGEALARAGDALGAARLLNDRAAVHVRLGDPLRALALLQKSREVFGALAERLDPVGLLEQAETDHLIARVPLHVDTLPGNAAQAIADAMSAARAAEAAYQRFRASRQLARVWETMGRLELLASRPDAALAHLKAAARAAQDAGDAVGLARSADAIAEALSERGERQQAVGWLSDSVHLNLAKRSPMGLAYNRQTLELLSARAGPDSPDRDALVELAEKIEIAQAEVHQPASQSVEATPRAASRRADGGQSPAAPALHAR